MRIVHLNTNLRWGGGENQILELVQRTADQEFRPLLLARRHGELMKRAKEAGVDVEPFDFFSRHGFLAAARLTGKLRTSGATLLHAHDGNAVSLGTLAARLFGKIPLLIHRRISSPLRNNILTRLKYADGPAGYIAVSESVKIQLVSIGAKEERIKVIHSGIDTDSLRPPADRASLRRELGLDEGIWFGTVTTLAPKKNTESFVQAAALLARKIPAARFALLGDGPDRARLEKLAADAGLAEPVFRFLGFRPDAQRFTAAMDCFLFPSLLEGSPGAVKEAMALGVPVVAARAPGTTEILTPETGILTPPKDPGAMAEAALSLVTDETKAQDCVRQARDRVASLFSLDQTVNRTKEFYRELHLG